MRKLIALCSVVLLAGCSMNMQLMARDGGKIYAGHLEKTNPRGGNMSVDIDGAHYAGSWVVVPQGTSMVLINQYGHVSSGAAVSMSNPAKALLSSADGRGLRCDMAGSMLAATGVCVDDAGHVYDVISS